MRERAKKILLELKEKNKVLSDVFDDYVKHLSVNLEINESIAVSLVTEELINKYQKDLILHELFSKSTLENLEKNNHP